jgi:hypothetical protein
MQLNDPVHIKDPVSCQKVPMAARSKARTVFGSSKTGIACSNTAWGMDVCVCVFMCRDVLCR